MLNPLNPKADVQFVEITDSTMNAARRITDGSAAVESGTVIQAGVQTAGRGRLPGRSWESEQGESLLFTVMFSKADLSRRMKGRVFTLLPLLCGLGVAAAVEDFLCTNSVNSTDIRIKWPNDILAGGRKLCGILCEASADWVYAGIGININQKSFPEGLRRPACSIRMLYSQEQDVSGGILLNSILGHIGAALENDDWRTAVEQRLYKLNEIVEMRPGLPEGAETGSLAEEIFGRLAGIDNSGALLLDVGAEMRSIVSGELVI